MRSAFVPNASLTAQEVLAALCRPMRIEAAERVVEEYVPGHHAVLFASCRGALATAAAVLAPSGSVAIAGYTCIAVPNAVVTVGCRPIYVDVDECGIVPPDSWTGADLVVVQDTYGFRSPPPVGRLVVRDASLCADGFSCEAGVAVTVTSFEQSKALCAGQGGLALTRDRELADKLRGERDEWSKSDRGTIHSLVTLLSFLSGRACYRGRKIGAVERALFNRLANTRAAGNSAAELCAGGVDRHLLGTPPRTVARLIVGQLARAEALARRRAEVAAIYDQAAGVQRTPPALSRYPMVISNPEAFVGQMRAAGWDVSSRWFNAPLHPRAAAAERFGYTLSSDSNARRLAETVVNLPTHQLVTAADAEALGRAAVEAGARPLVPLPREIRVAPLAS